ncbi:MAG: hypothetical protein K2X35_13115 [Bryobacteraceae bacterium]|nr:hypothetical protein [Bryobacteraceae bacterium]
MRPRTANIHLPRSRNRFPGTGTRLLALSLSMRRKLDLAAAWGILALGVIHCLFTPFAHRKFTEASLWFFAAGLALLYAGAFNLVRIRYADLRGLRRACFAVNLTLLGFVLAFAAYTLPRNLANPAAWLLILLCAAATWFAAPPAAG